ncbi:MAG: DUF2309 domain-containing protein [Myxococcales bacterium]|nr:DUF2309 domain-containing protein [Myxococcales bacterium]
MKPPSSDADPEHVIAEALGHAAHLLPNQAPLARFVHHNTLHAFEDLPFEEALIEARRLFGAQPFLEEPRFEEALATGRILREDLVEAIRAGTPEPGPLGHGLPSRAALRMARLSHPLPGATGEAVDWLMSESDLLRRLRPEVEPDVAKRLRKAAARKGGEPAMLPRLWRRCLHLAVDATPEPDPSVRPRDQLLAVTGLDAGARVDPFLIRFLSAYVDQGVAYWPMPARDGLWSSFVRLGATTGTPAWATELDRELDLARDRDAMEQVLHELALLDLPQELWPRLVHEALQALPGWAGMVNQLETRPDLAPGVVPPIALLDYLAIRLLLDRLAFSEVAREADLASERFEAALEAVRAHPVEPPDPRGLALELFVMAQRLGLGPDDLYRSGTAKTLAAEVVAFDLDARRTIWLHAYERRLRVDVLDAIAARARDRRDEPSRPKAQIVMCIDDREESFRRQLEEVDPAMVTYGYAGNYDVLMSYVAHGAARPVPLCPPVVTPQHRVREVPVEATGRGLRPALGKAGHHRHVASRTLVRGGFVAITGVASALPLVARTLAPGLSDRLARIGRSVLSPEVVTRLELTREVGVDRSEDGLFEGYTWDEQASIVENVLSSIGLTDGFAELVLIAGHGSSSVNNPHAAAYNCGACAGGKGGPNARAFAAMANHPEVRTRLAKRGLTLPDGTHFLGCEHDTATDAFTWYDEGAIPEALRERVEAVRRSLAEASALDAHERCRRFPDARLDMTPAQALRHAAARTVDLAQTRPEYCHATNALAVIGRRSLTRGLFLDRRAFLVSYDPTQDDAEGHRLEKLLGQVAPVGAGINLEYYFSRVDQDRYGCGTKLPHNITGLLGVMNGHGSDLRTGLHWQTVEIHEPVRLLTVVESTPEILLAIADRHEGVRRLVTHRWLLLATVHPETGEVSFFGPGGFEKHAPSTERLTHAESSRALYGGHRDHLPFALIHPTELHR